MLQQFLLCWAALPFGQKIPENTPEKVDILYMHILYVHIICLIQGQLKWQLSIAEIHQSDLNNNSLK